MSQLRVMSPDKNGEHSRERREKERRSMTEDTSHVAGRIVYRTSRESEVWLVSECDGTWKEIGIVLGCEWRVTVTCPYREEVVREKGQRERW